MYYSSLSVSWPTRLLVEWKIVTKVPNQKVARWPKCFSSFFFFFRQASSKLCDSFTMISPQNSSILHWAVHQPIAFLQLWSLTRHFKLVTEEVWLHLWCHFVHFYTCINYLVTKHNYYSRSLCAWTTGIVLIIHCRLCIWTHAWSVIFQPISTEEDCEDRLAALC